MNDTGAGEPASGPTSRMLGRLADLVSARPGLVVIVAVLMAAVGMIFVLRIEVTTSRTNLGHAKSESERQFGVFLDEFGSPNDLTAVIDGLPAAEARKAADELASDLEKQLGGALEGDGDKRPRVRSTFHKVDIDFFLRRILLFVPANELPQIRRSLESSFAEDVRAGKMDGLHAVVDEITSAFAGRGPTEMDPQRVASGLDSLRLIVEEFERRLKDPSRKGLEGFRDLIPPLKAGAIDDEGYLQSRDGKLRLVFIRPASRSDENAVVLPLVDAVRAVAAAVSARHPGCRIRITGLPALQADEQKIVDRDMTMTTLVSLIAITIILLYGYRKPQQVALSLVPLAIGIIITMAIVEVKDHRINIVASAFMPILLGRGSDFAIYIMARFNAARAQGLAPKAAVRESLASAGGGVVTGALVTSAAFLVSTLGQLGAFAQLGTVVGIGLVVVLIASLTVTPALLLLVGDRKFPGEVRAERIFDELPAFGAGPGAIALRRPGLVLGITAAGVIVLGAFARGVPTDYDLLKFLPPGAESVTAQNDLSSRSDYGTDVVVVNVDDVDDAGRVAAALAAKPNVGRVESIASFLPNDQERKLEVIATMRKLVETIPAFNEPVPPTSPERVGKALEDLSDAVDDKIFLADQGAASDEKLRPVVDKLKEFNGAISSAMKTLNALPAAERQKNLANIEDEVFSLLIYSRKLLRDNVLDAKKVSIEDLPRATFERFVGRPHPKKDASGKDLLDGNGKPIELRKSAVYVFPKKAGAGDELTAFVADVRSVTPNATGFPIIYYDSSRSINRAFIQAAFFALGVIVLALLLHFRRLLDTGIALLPLAIASVTMLGLMRIFSIEKNMANIVALPLLLGLGTDYGLQLVHHYRTVPEDSLPEVLKKTGLGVFMAGGTTAAGFGALALARHHGGASLGVVLFLGTSAALVCSLVVLPAILAVVEKRRPRRKT